MRVLLIKDVYKLGRAGDVKKVADGYGRNFLIPKGLAVLATEGALKMVDNIRANAATHREQLNNELSGVAERLTGESFVFVSKAGETGKLYGSITTQMIADAIQGKLGIAVDRHQIETEPIRTLGDHKALVRLTVDLLPEIFITVRREGQTYQSAVEKADIKKELPQETAAEPEITSAQGEEAAE